MNIGASRFQRVTYTGRRVGTFLDPDANSWPARQERIILNSKL